MYHCNHCHKHDNDKAGWYFDGIGGAWCQNCVFLALELLDQDPPNTHEPDAAAVIGAALHDPTPAKEAMLRGAQAMDEAVNAAPTAPAGLGATYCLGCGRNTYTFYEKDGAWCATCGVQK